MTPLVLDPPLAATSAGAPPDRWTLAVRLDAPGRSDSESLVTHPSCPGLQIHFDGLLFDADAIRDEMRAADDDSDGALVLRLYAQGGDSALARLRGTFAFVLLDGRRDRVLAARDPIGMHPLFYSESRGTITFAASPLALAGASARPALNRAALADHLCHRWPDPEETFFEDIRRVLPGSRVTVSGGRVSRARYWDPLPPGEAVRWCTQEDVEQFDEVLTSAVDRCLSTGATGIFLSGGLDSISVAAVAADRARAQGHPLPLALSLGFDDASCDERPTQQLAARLLGLDHTLIGFDEALGSRGLFEQALDLTRRWPFPLNNTWNPAYMSLAERGKAAGVQTILTGTGGDEWLTVSAFLAADLIRAGDGAGFARLVGSWRRSYPASLLKIARSTLWTFGLRPLVSGACHRIAPDAWDRRRLRLLLESDPDWVAPDRLLRADQAQRGARCVPDANPPHGYYLREMRTGLDHPIVTMELEERHEIGRQLGLRFLHPFWDADLVDLLFRTPPSLLDRDGRSKGLIRQKLAARFPALGLSSQKKVAATSFHQSLMTAEAARLRQLVGPLRALPALGVVDARKATAAIDDAFATGRALHRAWDLLNLETWSRSYVH